MAFLYVSNNNLAIDVSIGYFLFKEKLSKLKIIAILFAIIGIILTVITTGPISWATLMVLIGEILDQNSYILMICLLIAIIMLMNDGIVIQQKIK